MKNTEQASYTGKEVFIGVDVHKKNYSVVAKCDKEVVKKWTTAASPQELSQQLQKYFGGAIIHSVYEAGFSGFALHRELVKQGIDNIVVHAVSIEVAANNRVKTDKGDAQKMAALLEAGRLKGNRIPSEQEEHRRMLTRTRQQLFEDRTGIKNKIRMKFHQLGLIEYDENRPMSHKLVKELLRSAPFQEFTMVIEAYCNIWQKLDEEIYQLAPALIEQAKTDPNEATYRSAPGLIPLWKLSHLPKQRQILETEQRY